MSAAEFAEMLGAALKGVQATGERAFGRGAIVGDKTLVDALAPYVECWKKEAALGTCLPKIFVLAAEAAVKGAKDTEQIAARMGRAGAVGDRSIGFPDAGAHALGVIFTEAAKSIK